MKEIKHQFMAYRNGIVSDTLRKAGMPYDVIFGLQLPQLSAIARNYGKDATLADALWADSKVRESRILACYIFPAETMTEERALGLAESVLTHEEADILCFRLLRYLPFADRLALTLAAADGPLARYCGEALRRNLDA